MLLLSAMDEAPGKRRMGGFEGEIAEQRGGQDTVRRPITERAAASMRVPSTDSKACHSEGTELRPRNGPPGAWCTVDKAPSMSWGFQRPCCWRIKNGQNTNEHRRVAVAKRRSWPPEGLAGSESCHEPSSQERRSRHDLSTNGSGPSTRQPGIR